MRYCSIVAGVLSFVLFCVATGKLNALIFRLRKDDGFGYARGKLIAIPLGLGFGGLVVLVYSVLWGLPYECALLCEETIGVALMGVGSSSGLLIAAFASIKGNKDWRKTIVFKRTAMLLYGISAVIVAVVFCVDHFLV
ncbi:MAG: hypothetical protein IJ518_07325 [Clostridia bacterium]|nr:hypothetical protein [Clostridia bacterium]